MKSFSARRFVFFCLMLVAAIPFRAATLAQESQSPFDVARLPAALAAGADAVVRSERLRFTVTTPGLATTHVQRAVTVLNLNGREHALQAVLYDRFRSLKSLQGSLLDAQGRKIRELKKSDLKDESAISDFSLYEDHRVRYAQLYHEVYPYTAVFEYEIAHQGLISWPAWYPQEDDLPVEFSSFELTVPAEMPVRYYLRGAIGDPQLENHDKLKTLRWQATMLQPLAPEPEGPGWREQADGVLTAPTQFEIAGYSGDMSSWESFGRWFHQLAQGRTVLPPAALEKVMSLTAPFANPREKARTLYEYLQSTTRYVSVQLGIGGWQPFDATYVSTRGYGDCKALSNYMIAMLAAVDLRAWPALINNGADAAEVLADFPSNQFNHMIVCVPFSRDTLWLECTNALMPFGQVGRGNEDRQVLVVTPEGGKLLRTPRSQAGDNQQIRQARVIVDPAGNAGAEVRTRYTGNQHVRVRSALAHSAPREREDWLRRQITIGSFQITSVDFSGVERKSSEITLPLTLTLPRFAAVSGSRMFLRPNLLERRKYVPPAMPDRKQPVLLTYAYVDVDSIHYRLPEGFAIEALPEPVKLTTSFGGYEATTVVQEEGALLYVRRLEMRANRLPAQQYEEYRQFLANVVKADAAQVVLVRK